MEFNGEQSDLIRRLQLAYSGELGAAIAYVGHAASVRNPADRDQILRIEAEERVHRRGQISRPVRTRRNGRASPLLSMAEVEWDHAEFFRLMAISHWLSRLFPATISNVGSTTSRGDRRVVPALPPRSRSPRARATHRRK
jgi:hypothetical protein